MFIFNITKQNTLAWEINIEAFEKIFIIPIYDLLKITNHFYFTSVINVNKDIFEELWKKISECINSNHDIFIKSIFFSPNDAKNNINYTFCTSILNTLSIIFEWFEDSNQEITFTLSKFNFKFTELFEKLLKWIGCINLKFHRCRFDLPSTFTEIDTGFKNSSIFF